MKRMFFGFAPLLVACSLMAQDVPEAETDESLDQEVTQEEIATEEDASEAEPEAPLGQGAAIQEMNEAADSDVPYTPMEPKEQLQAYLAERDDMSPGYDEEKDRIIVIQQVEFDIKNPEVSGDFVDLRQEKMGELLLMAKSQIINTIMSKMSGERILKIPGNPIAKQLAKKTRELDKQRTALQKQIARLDADLQKQAESLHEVTFGDLKKLCADWISKKAGLDSITEDKQELYDNTMKDLEEAIAAEAELAEQADEIKGSLSKEMKSSVSRLSQMPIYGCTVLQQAEGVTEENGKYTYKMAIIYAWSGEMQEAAGEILQGNSITFAPGKKSFKKWLNGKVNNGALSRWVGPKNYIDDKGHMWFVGIASAPVEDDADDNMAAQEMAGLQAAAEVMYALYADAYSSQQLEKVTRTVTKDDGSKDTEIFKDYSKEQGEAFKDIMISGNTEYFSGTLHHDPSGVDLNVVVYALDSSSPKRLKEIKDRAVALGIEVNTSQERERGRQEEMQSMFEASKTNEKARAEGRADARADQAKRAADRKAKRAAASKARRDKIAPKKGYSGSSTKSKGKLRSGSYFIIDDDDE